MIAMLIEKPYRNHLNILRFAGAVFLIEQLARAINRRATAQLPKDNNDPPREGIRESRSFTRKFIAPRRA
jgi:hypothetical protein